MLSNPASTPRGWLHTNLVPGTRSLDRVDSPTSKNLYSTVPEHLVASLFESERPILASLAECRWSLDVSFEESRPS
jgi:hypothetical protein